MSSRKAIVALSGGVDSAVAAALLLEHGYDVEGVYLKYASETTRGFVDPDLCGWKEDMAAVESVGAALGIPVRSINVEREYDDRVISIFLNEYRRGRTPNPDILCNRDIKFGLFASWARAHGADVIATGHYARSVNTDSGMTLRAGSDASKDQSYFLYAIPREVLAYTLFPIGDMQKRDVRAYARTRGLPNAGRPDSQGVCFIGHIDVSKFLRSHIDTAPGPITTSDGAVIGTHDGLPFYTIGQRHGLNIGGGIPYFVAEKDFKNNTLVVAKGDTDPVLLSAGLEASSPTWLVNEVPKNFSCQVRIRYRQPRVAATVQHDTNGIRITFDTPQRAVAPGQAVVLYDNDTVLGGATIERGFRSDEIHATL